MVEVIHRTWKQKHGNIETHDIYPGIAIPPKTIHDFFMNIFQAPSLNDAPILADIEDEINNYNVFSNNTDFSITMDEIEYATKKKEKGTSFDGISYQFYYLQ